MKLLILTRYSTLGSSSRVRFFQYIPYLRSLGWEIEVMSFLDNAYVQRLYESNTRSLFNVLKSYLKRFAQLSKDSDSDIIWIEKELMQWLPAPVESYLLRKYKNRYLIDYDDATFHNYDRHKNYAVRKIYKNKINRMMANSYCVLAGNEYIANYAIESNASRVEIFPTVIDLKKYPVVKYADNTKVPFVVGWIGSPSTVKYLRVVEEPLRILAKKINMELLVIGVKDAGVSGIPVRYIDWSEDTEVESISKMDIGIMPLLDSPWERGKCGYKLIQYMACGKPVVASPVGVNNLIVTTGFNGYLAECNIDWVNAINELYNNKELAGKMGLNGRDRVVETYSLQATAPRLAGILMDGVGS